MSEKIIVVTGAAGFIGSHLVERLLELGNKVIGLDNFDDFYAKSYKENNLKNALQSSNYSFFETDITSKEALNKLPITQLDAVVHLAARAGVRPSIQNPTSYIETNITGTLNILEWMHQKQCNKLVFASSSSIYGNNPIIPFSETDVVDNPISPYAFTKKSGELLTYNFHHLYNLDVINLRFFTVFGERQRPDLAIHKFVRMIDEGQPITLFGTGSTSRDYTYIADIVQGIEASINYLFIHQNVYEVINLGNNTPVQLSEMVDIIYQEMGVEPNITYLSMQAGDVERTFASIEKAQTLLGYQPTTSFREGIRRFINWYKATLSNR